MLTGYSTLRYPDQPEPLYALTPEDSYFLVSLHQAQAYFQSPALVRPASLTLVSTVESPFQPGQPLNSLHQIASFQKNQAFRLPIHTNLSSYLPARSNDTLRICLKYIVTRDNPFQKLADKMKSANLVAKISAASPEWGVALKVSEISAALLSHLLQEGGENTIFELTADLNVADLKAGYYAVYGSPYRNVEPNMLRINRNQELEGDEYLSRFCWAVFRVLAIPSLKEEAARERAWWQLLQMGKTRALAGLQGGNRQEEAVLAEWNATLLHVEELARKDHSFLVKEIRQIMGKAQLEIDEKLHSGKQDKMPAVSPYSEDMQKILGVANAGQLSATLHNYREAVEVTEQLLDVYEKGNPFEYGSSVPPERFWGRRGQIDFLHNRLGGISAQSISIVGLRRTGKTSLLRYVASRPHEFCRKEQRPVIVSLDLQKAHLRSATGILEGLRRGILQSAGIEAWKPEENGDPYCVEGGLQRIRDEGRTLIVLIDEFEQIESCLARFSDWGSDWRAKASAGLLILVTASMRPIDEIYQHVGLSSPFGNIFETTTLGAFERGEWEQAVTRNFAECGRSIGAGELNLISDLGGGFPFFTQMAASLLYRLGDEENVRKEFRIQTRPRFKEIWRDLDAAEHDILLAKARNEDMPPDEERAQREEALSACGLLRPDGGLFSTEFQFFLRHS
jgi:hypothetical protein